MKRLAITALAGIALLAAACTDAGTEGTARPEPNRTAPPTASSTADKGDQALASLKPCDLLTTGEVTGLGLDNPGRAERIGGADACNWTVSGNGGLIVGIRAKQGFKDLDYSGDRTFETRAGKFEATRIEAPGRAKGICHLVISVSDTASVQLSPNVKTTPAATAAACERAGKAADLVASKLP